jgi:hypothetical protein
MLARLTGVHRYLVTDRDGRNLRSEFGHDAGDLVAEDHRFLEAHGPEAAMKVVVQIGAADASGSDAHLHLPRTKGLWVSLDDSEIARGM